MHAAVSSSSNPWRARTVWVRWGTADTKPELNGEKGGKDAGYLGGCRRGPNGTNRAMVLMSLVWRARGRVQRRLDADEEDMRAERSTRRGSGSSTRTWEAALARVAGEVQWRRGAGMWRLDVEDVWLRERRNRRHRETRRRRSMAERGMRCSPRPPPP
jgi:hypothetical protein